MAEQEEDYSSLPLTDRWVHKVWKVRKGAYEDAAKAFEKTVDEYDNAFKPFLQDPSLWKGAVADSNVAAQQDGIAALCAFLKFGGKEHASRTRGYTISPLAEKGLSSTRAATKTNAVEAILLYIELEVIGPTIDDLLPTLSNKQPKVVAATLACLTAIYHNYGCKTVDPKPVLKALPKSFGHADKNVRAEATKLAVEFYRWLREAMKPMFWNDLKPTQQTEMEAQFEKIKSEPAPKQERYLRSQQEARASGAAAGEDGEGPEDDEPDAEPAEIDVFDLAEPQEVLSKIPATFHEQLASSKWKERKEALEALYAAVNVPRIKDADYSDIARCLAKCMKDANIAVVTNAAQCVEALGKGLRKSFGKYRSTLTQPIMERLKEKKASVADALGAALDQIFATTSLSEVLEDIVEYLKHKNPQVKEGTMKFLIRSLRTTRDVPSKPELTTIVEGGKKLLSESSEGLRSGGAEVLGTVMKIIGERAMNPYLEGLDEIRKTKIKEFYETAEVKAKDKPKAPPPKAAPKAAALAPKKVVGKKPPMKKAVTAPAPQAAPEPTPEPATAPLAPQPTARSRLGMPKSGLAGPGGLKAPMKRTLAGPGGAAPPSVTSPRKAAPVAAPMAVPVEEEAPPAPKFGIGRGLAGRPLGRPAAIAPPRAPSPEIAVPSGISAAERAELEELRLERDRLTRQVDELRQDRTRFNSEIQELKNQNAQLIEDHTRDVLSIKAKETQLVRARSDAEAAEARCAQMRREMERLKRALTTAERVGVTSPSVGSPTRDYGDQDVYRDNGLTGQEMPRTYSNPRSRGTYNTMGEEKENGIEFSAPYGRSKLSPDVLSSGRGSAASNNTGRNSPGSTYRREVSGTSSTSGGDDRPAESWKRAAEVTSALKLKIEQMKARQGLNRP